MARGVTIYGANVAASGASVNFQKNLIAEQAMGLGGEPKIYSSGGVATGTVEAAYRATALKPIASAINSCIANGTAVPYGSGSMIISDEKGSMSFSSHAVNSFELSMSAKDYGKCTIGYVATGVSMGASTGVAGSYADDIPVFYSCNVGSNVLTGFTIKMEIPIDTDYFILGTSDLQDILQNGNGTISGSLKFGPGATDITSISSFTATFTGGTVTLTNLAVSDVSMSGQGRQRFERTVNFRAPCSSTVNNAIFG